MELDPIPDAVKDHTHWLYASGEQGSTPRQILGSVFLRAVTRNNCIVNMTHLVLMGSRQ